MKEISKFIEILKVKIKEHEFNIIEKVSISLLLSFFWVALILYIGDFGISIFKIILK